jgi:PBS lyase HEAT-like repeat
MSNSNIGTGKHETPTACTSHQRLPFEAEGLSLSFYGEYHRQVYWDEAARCFKWGASLHDSANELARRYKRAGETRPSPEEWDRFWNILEKIQVWGWQPDYGSHIIDGLPWHLTIVHSRGNLKCRGNLTAGSPPYWDLFERSLDALIGRPHERSESWFEPAVEKLSDLLALAEIACSRSAAATSGLIRFLEQGGVGGQTLLDLLSAINPAERAHVIPELIRSVQDGDERKYWGVRALGHIGLPAPGVVSALRDHFGDPEYDYSMSRVVADALAQIGPDAEVLSTLIDAVRNGTPTRYAAAQALGKIGPAAQAAIPALIEASSDPNEYTRGVVMRALTKIRSVEA